MNLFFVVFRFSVLLTNSINKLIHNRACVQTNNCVSVFVSTIGNSTSIIKSKRNAATKRPDFSPNSATAERQLTC